MSSPTPDTGINDDINVQIRLNDIDEGIQTINERLSFLGEQLATIITAYNQTGENVQWLVANTQGIFQMFNNPEMMSKLMGQVLGGGNANGGH